MIQLVKKYANMFAVRPNPHAKAGYKLPQDCEPTFPYLPNCKPRCNITDLSLQNDPAIAEMARNFMGGMGGQGGAGRGQ
jgi:hypothetical protein